MAETRDSELVAKLRGYAKAFSEGGERRTTLNEAADTIDRLTSTGEAVWYQQRQKREGETEWSNWYDSSKDAFEEWQRGNIGGKYFFGPVIYEVRALYTHASPREGHVEVPVEPTEAMLDAGFEVCRTANREQRAAIYRAMLAAASQGKTKP